jgi:hypothetical protein
VELQALGQLRLHTGLPGRLREGAVVRAGPWHGRSRHVRRAGGYAILFITSRSAAQEAATLGNLTADGVGVDAGYPKPTTLTNGEDGLFTKPAVADYPNYLKAACTSDPNGVCRTIHYKSATRAHIESLGYDIVANLGDQYSDLQGGHADRTLKLPNPTYFLP